METNKPKEETWNQPFQESKSHYRNDNKRVLTGILAIVLGSLGVHKFVLGYNNEGFIILIATIIGYATLCFVLGGILLAATSLLGLIEGIIYLSKSDSDFYETYQQGKKPWF